LLQKKFGPLSEKTSERPPVYKYANQQRINVMASG
jgi:hypothetical protein